ncbi:MAG: hypothetical protein GY859_40720 [Desulfobacterales bacterium]|nr:hypothetical protein [Desulfobacterales bacterium]
MRKNMGTPRSATIPGAADGRAIGETVAGERSPRPSPAPPPVRDADAGEAARRTQANLKRALVSFAFDDGGDAWIHSGNNNSGINALTTTSAVGVAG